MWVQVLAGPPFTLMKIINLHYQKVLTPDIVKVDRGSPWGNPFVKGIDGDRNEVCDLFELYAKWRLSIQPNWLDPLKDKTLACWCTPKRCHSETLYKLANKL